MIKRKNINVPTREHLNQLPHLNETEKIPLEDKVVHLHFQVDKCHWWAIEWDGEDTFFGLVLLHGCRQYAEFGYFTLSELQEIKIEGWLEVVNDPFWTPALAKEVYLIKTPPQFQSS